MPNAPVIRVFLADDHKTTLWGLTRLMASAEDRMELVGTATSRAELLARAASARADVIVLDLDLGGEDAVQVLPELRQQTAAQVLVLTGSRDQRLHEYAVLQGVRGVMQKSDEAETLLRAIERVHAGEVWLNRSLVGRVMGNWTAASAAPGSDPQRRKIDSLTPRERNIIATIVKNKGAKSLVIASQLNISEHTLRNHLTTIYSKLELRGRLELFVYATEHGLTGH